jgi:hypothetical protein
MLAYFNANGRYEKKKTLLRLIDHAKKLEAIALKAIAKTLSMTMKIAKVAKEEYDFPCFCADPRVNPILVDWNKNIAARLDPVPGLGTGLSESNGHQNYKNWPTMEKPTILYADADLCKTVDSVFNLGEDFYDKSGGILADSKHYKEMFSKHGE